jgi:hypothetical protein
MIPQAEFRPWRDDEQPEACMVRLREYWQSAPPPTSAIPTRRTISGEELARSSCNDELALYGYATASSRSEASLSSVNSDHKANRFGGSDFLMDQSSDAISMALSSWRSTPDLASSASNRTSTSGRTDVPSRFFPSEVRYSPTGRATR